MTKRWALIGALLLCARGLFAGDVANFLNLGFSPDAKYFLFGEYGVNGSSNPYADLFGVDVSSNRFVPNGVRSKTYPVHAHPGQDGLGALFTLYSDYLPVSRRHHIDHLMTGRDLYLRVDGSRPPSRLEFRDFLKNTRYTVALDQHSYGSGKSVSSSFSIALTVQDSKGKSFHYTVGLPSYRRSGVESYRIKKIILAPDNRSLVFVIEKHELDKDGVNVRYMVETVRTGL